ncbi:hypothetical protein K443DRAFT_13472 [Laccaria amethystina LaAM-08-1]|uniref:Uncharacterized protein n=1 Tax=Laccaria amethystina LaAM-08-1 TaxID=1095629 RepID=A0A0C9WP76_9AGAR|nr:hypothetical protein K443DRAFT_13472 [Laccaria amethystina LaAM-08-1]
MEKRLMGSSPSFKPIQLLLLYLELPPPPSLISITSEPPPQSTSPPKRHPPPPTHHLPLRPSQHMVPPKPILQHANYNPFLQRLPDTSSRQPPLPPRKRPQPPVQSLFLTPRSTSSFSLVIRRSNPNSSNQATPSAFTLPHSSRRFIGNRRKGTKPSVHELATRYTVISGVHNPGVACAVFLADDHPLSSSF